MAITTIKTRHSQGCFEKVYKGDTVIGMLQQVQLGWWIGSRAARTQFGHYSLVDALPGVYETKFDAIKAWCLHHNICYPKE